jgi:hypothetical protein
MIEITIIAALLHDVSNAHGSVFNTRACKKTSEKVFKRVRAEGMGFLTKTLPRLGKAFDKALAGDTPLNSTGLGFKPQPGSELPSFLGEFFNKVLGPDGRMLQHPCADCVKVIREILYLFYKYELPFTDDQEQAVIQKFVKTEDDIKTNHQLFDQLEAAVNHYYRNREYLNQDTLDLVAITRRARNLLSRLFVSFDPKDVIPRHGPGAVATKQRLWDKYRWTNVSANITKHYPFDEYFCSSIGHVCDRWQTFASVTDEDLPARVLLVPKDSRGPRLISCEPVDYQWIQQGLGRAIVELVERHKLTKFNVHFTDQQPNQFGALLGSSTGRYSTLDLNEASDRVSVGLVRLLFPETIFDYLMACRSSSTVLPDGSRLELQKFAPMGSCLCFPILALTVWAILAAGAPDAYTRERILVYGDDVIVPTAYAGDAIKHLESFGLKVNRDKSCTSGLFRESCGTDAFNGINVTPVRLRTVWSSSPRPETYTSWIAYANSFYDRKRFLTYDLIVRELLHVYREIPDASMSLTCPSLRETPDGAKPKRRRWNKSLQKLEYYVTDIKSPVINKEIDGWSMLLRYFTEGHKSSVQFPTGIHQQASVHYKVAEAFSVSTYTKRGTSMLVRRWR